MRQLKRVKTAWLTAREQARKTFLQAELKSLGESLKVRQLQPVWCDAAGSLIVGERRWRAATLVGLEELDAIVTDENLSPTEIKLIQAEENWHRSDLSPWERFVMCQELLALNPDWHLKELAGRLHIDASTLTRVLAPAKCIPAVQEAFQAGALGVTDCYAISKASVAEQHELLAAKFDGSSRDQLERAVRRKHAAPGPESRVNRVPIPLPNGVTVAVSGSGLTLENISDALTDAQRAVRDGRKEHQSITTFVRVMADKAKGRVP